MLREDDKKGKERKRERGDLKERWEHREGEKGEKEEEILDTLRIAGIQKRKNVYR